MIDNNYVNKHSNYNNNKNKEKKENLWWSSLTNESVDLFFSVKIMFGANYEIDEMT